MGNSKAVGGIVVGIAIVAIIAVYALNQDQADESNEKSIEPTPDSASISDLATLTENNPNYTVDEEGNKKYVLTVTDTPSIKP